MYIYIYIHTHTLCNYGLTLFVAQSTFMETGGLLISGVPDGTDPENPLSSTYSCKNPKAQTLNPKPQGSLPRNLL